MSATKRFWDELREDEEYYNLTVRAEVFTDLNSSRTAIREKDWTLNSIKQNNPLHKEDETLIELKKEKRKIDSKIREREQFLNHNKK